MKKSEQATARKKETAAPAETPPAAQGPVVSDETLSREEIAQILQQRARTIAQPAEAETAGDSIQVVVFALGKEQYAVAARFVESIYPLESITPVPCTPAFVRGVVNLRGRILSVVDLHHFMGLGSVQIDEDSQVIVVNAAGLEVGLLSNEVRSVGPLVLRDLRPALPTTARVATEYTRGVTADMLVLLDIEALLKDSRMVVQEEVA